MGDRLRMIDHIQAQERDVKKGKSLSDLRVRKPGIWHKVSIWFANVISTIEWRLWARKPYTMGWEDGVEDLWLALALDQKITNDRKLVRHIEKIVEELLAKNKDRS